MDPEDCQVMNSKPSDPRQRRPDGRMYFVENEVQSEGNDWQIANVVNWRRQRLECSSRPGTSVPYFEDRWTATASLYCTRSGTLSNTFMIQCTFPEVTKCVDARPVTNISSAVCIVDDAVDFVTPLKKRRLARESLSVDGSLRSISEEEDSPSARMASPPDAMPPSGTVASIDNFAPEVTLAASTNECHSQVRILTSGFSLTSIFLWTAVLRGNQVGKLQDF